jgi:hypothetical protein
MKNKILEAVLKLCNLKSDDISETQMGHLIGNALTTEEYNSLSYMKKSEYINELTNNVEQAVVLTAREELRARWREE